MTFEETKFDLPLFVFIDTNAFEEKNFSFSCDSLIKIMEHRNESNIELITPDIITTEIRRRIKKSTNVAKNTIKNNNEARRSIRILGHDEDIWSKLNRTNYYRELESIVVEKYNSFLSETKAIILSVDDVKPSVVFEKYFEIKPPFVNGDKEKEFPDAFALESLLMHAKSSGKKIHVVSSDKGFKKACEQNHAFSYFENIDLFIQHVLKVVHAVESGLIDECHDWVHENSNVLMKEIADAFGNVDISLSASWGRINSKNIIDFETIKEAVVEIDDTHAVMTGSIILETILDVEFEVEGEDTYYDANDNLVIPFVDIKKDLGVFFKFPFRLILDLQNGNIHNLREISFEIADKVVISPDDYVEYDIRSEP